MGGFFIGALRALLSGSAELLMMDPLRPAAPKLIGYVSLKRCESIGVFLSVGCLLIMRWRRAGASSAPAEARGQLSGVQLSRSNTVAFPNALCWGCRNRMGRIPVMMAKSGVRV